LNLLNRWDRFGRLLRLNLLNLWDRFGRWLRLLRLNRWDRFGLLRLLTLSHPLDPVDLLIL